MNFELKKEDWGIFLDNLSKRRFEWMTEIEIINDQVGHQVLSNGLPLAGVTAETVGDRTSIVITVGETTNNHITHTINDPTRIAFLVGEGAQGDVIDIEEANGTKTLIRLKEPMGLLVGIAEYEVMVAAA